MRCQLLIDTNPTGDIGDECTQTGGHCDHITSAACLSPAGVGGRCRCPDGFKVVAGTRSAKGMMLKNQCALGLYSCISYIEKGRKSKITFRVQYL